MTLRVCYVDDSATQRHLVSQALPRVSDISVVVCETLAECLDLAANADAVLLDMHLDPPLPDPLDGLRAVLAQYPELPVICYTSDTTLGEAAMEAGATNFVTKDLNVWAMLATMIKDAVKRRSVEKGMWGLSEEMGAAIESGKASDVMRSINDRWRRALGRPTKQGNSHGAA